jgi:hypothetical protein
MKSFNIFTFSLIAQKYDDVRSQLILTLKLIIPLVRKSHLFPFLHLIATFIATGMSHIREPIRLTALDTLNIWLCTFPELAGFHYSTILPNFVGLLVQQSLSGTVALPKKHPNLISPCSLLSNSDSKAIVISSLVHFIEIMHSERTRGSPEEDEGLASQSLKKSFEDIQCHSIFLITSNPVYHRKSVSNQHEEFPIRPCLESLLVVAIDHWIENKPDQSGLPIGKSSYQALFDVLRLISILWRYCLLVSQGVDNSNGGDRSPFSVSERLATQLSRHFLHIFPIQINASTTGDEEFYKRLSWDMNAVFYEFLASFLANTTYELPEVVSSESVDSLVKGCHLLLAGDTGCQSAEGSTHKRVNNQILSGNHTIPGSYWNEGRLDRFLSIMRSTFEIVPLETTASLLYMLVHSLSQSKNPDISRKAILFLRSNLLDFRYNRTFRKVWRDWILMIPKHLWEIRGKGDNSTWVEIALDALRLFLCQETDTEFLDTFQLSLIPLLSFHHHMKSLQDPRRAYGPFIHWNPRCQKLFCSIIGCFHGITEKLMLSWILCLQSSYVSGDIVEYMFDIWEASLSSGFPLPTYISAVLTFVGHECKDPSKNMVSPRFLATS